MADIDRHAPYPSPYLALSFCDFWLRSTPARSLILELDRYNKRAFRRWVKHREHCAPPNVVGTAEALAPQERSAEFSGRINPDPIMSVRNCYCPVGRRTASRVRRGKHTVS